MYSKQKASQIREEFWTAFGKYMAPVLSAEGERMNWINYKTGEKNIAFRMHADNKKATISIELTHREKDIQQLYFEQLIQLKNILTQSLNEDWNWSLHTTDVNGRLVSRIYKEITGINIFNKEDWPGLISFFKPRILALDEFWTVSKHAFEALR